MKHLIDISTYQKPVRMDYDKLAKQIDGVVLRLGYTGWNTGKDFYLDGEFRNHYHAFNKRKMPIGVYWFATAMTPEVAGQEAEFVLETVEKMELKLELPIFYDTEPAGGTGKIGHQYLDKKKLSAVIHAFCERIEQGGYYASIYASEYWFTERTDYAGLLNRYDRWVANWTREPIISYGMWQHSSTGRLDGYNYGLDLNIAHKDYPRIIREAGLNKLDQQFIHVVKTGETLWQISRQYNVSIDQIVSDNNIRNRDLIHTGDKIKIRKAGR